MGSNLLTYGSLFYSLMLVIIIISKKRINTVETRIYSWLVFSNFFGLIIAILCYFTVKNNSIVPILNYFVSRLYLTYLIVFIFLFFLYVISLLYPKFYEKHRKVLIFTDIMSELIITIIVFFLPMNYSSIDDGVYSYGPACNYVYCIAALSMSIWVLLLGINIKRIKNKKFIPVLMLIILASFTTYVQRINPSLLLTTSMETFIVILMYNTIENPDLKLINELNMAKDQAEKANRAKTDFLSSMSHEIRTPLNAIVGFSNSLNDNKDIPESAKADVKDILVASDNLLEIVNGVLDISKIEANKIEIIKKEYDTKKMLDELSKLTKVRIGEKPIEFITKFDESLPRVLYGDQTRVKQVILNILTNAAKYTDKGKIIFSVQSIIKDNVCRMIVSVEDTGRGIKKESIDKLFTKFERLDEDRNTTIEGTGLGLAITKKLVELMHGKIVVQSKYGEGSKFTVSIDQKIVKNPTISLDDNNSSNIEIFDLKGKKVLVVDDNKLNLKVATRLLTPYNLEITTSESGFDAIELLKNNKYDIILMDDMMPKMSGTETLKEIQKNKLYDGPIVALTANALTGMREKYIEHGFTDYLAKPIEKAELNRVLKTYLTKK